MEEIVKNLVWSVYSFVDMENAKAEMNRVLYNKKQRTKNEEEYINRLIINIGYYHILISNTIRLIEQCLADDASLTKDLLSSLVKNINSKCSDEIYYNEVSKKYFNGTTRINDHLIHGMGFVEKIEFDYVFYCFMVSLSQGFIEYFEDEINEHIRNYLLDYDPNQISSIILNELNKHSGDFADFYSPPKHVFVA